LCCHMLERKEGDVIGGREAWGLLVPIGKEERGVSVNVITKES